MATWQKCTAGLLGLMACAVVVVTAFQDTLPSNLTQILGRVVPFAEPKQPQNGREAKAGGAPVVVETAAVQRSKSSGDIRAIGTLQSDESVQVAAEIAGRVAGIEFNEGQPVKKGDTLLKLDDALARADVADAKSRRDLANINNRRTATLSKGGYATGRSRDEANSALETAQAALQVAETRLSKHTLTAPFDGIVGLRNVSVGAFVPVGQALFNIEKIDSLKVDFRVPELYLDQIKTSQTINVTVDALTGRTFVGEIFAIDPLIDINGRALKIRGRIPNADGALRPGLFARITIKGIVERDVVTVPESAVVPRGADSYVFRIDNGKAIEARVKLGTRSNAKVEILEGLDAAATVVIAGQQKLSDGTAVKAVERKAEPPEPSTPSTKSPARGSTG